MPAELCSSEVGILTELSTQEVDFPDEHGTLEFYLLIEEGITEVYNTSDLRVGNGYLLIDQLQIVGQFELFIKRGSLNMLRRQLQPAYVQVALDDHAVVLDVLAPLDLGQDLARLDHWALV